MTQSAAEVLAGDIVHTLRSNGFEAFLVGGCVRDRLLGLEPKDYDVATDATPEQVGNIFPDSRMVGAHFGVVLVRREEAEVEVATFRSDLAYADGRRPEGVRFETDPRQDAIRRDFTINAMMQDPDSGEVLDFVGGRSDLSAGLVRAIGDPAARFAEDHLRMLRAVRFAAGLGFEIEERTMLGIQKLCGQVRNVASERVRDELTRILTEGGARRGFELLDQSGLLEQVLPEIAALKGVPQPPEYHPEGDVWTHTMMMLERLSRPSAELAWGVLLHDVGKPPTFRVAERIRFDGHVERGVEMATEILARLRLSNEESRQILALIANHLRFKDVRKMKESTLKRFFRLPRFEEHLELHRLDCLASHRLLGNYEYSKQKFEAMPAEDLKPPKALTGKDLIREGYLPGNAFAKMLEAVEDAQLEGRVRTREEALELIRTRFGPP